MTTEDKPPPAIDPEVRRAALEGDLRARLRPICVDWPEEAFETMVREMAAVAMRFEPKSAPAYDRRATDRLIADMNAILERNAEARRRKE